MMQAGPMRDALKRKLAPPPEMELPLPSEEVEPEKASPEAEAVEESSYDEALSSLDACVAKLPEDKAVEAQGLIERLRTLFSKYERAEEAPEEVPEAKGPIPEL